ncbi:MAG: SufD family Fe-S cluster assembly protein [Cyanobacteriota bacterium]|nr:SufD family Fe-S cluster assembly protein [Cyanobacteriota bacterium]
MPTLSPLPHTVQTPPGSDWLRTLLEAWPEPAPTTAPAAADPLRATRRAARLALESAGIPGRRQEAWRFTDLSRLTALAPGPLAPDAGQAPALPPAATSTFRLHLSHPEAIAASAWPAGMERLEGAALENALGRVLADTDASGDWAVTLNSAIAPNVLALRIRGTVSPCLELVSQAGPRAGVLPLRLLLLLEEGATLTLLQVHQATGPSLTSVVMEIALERDARLHHGLVAQGEDSGALLAVTAVRQSPGSAYSQASLCSGWGLARQEPVILQSDGQASTRLRGLHWLEGQQISDTHSRMRFAGPEGTLDQLHKVVAAGESRSVFNGCVQVPRLAQRTAASQLSRGLLLSDRARIDTKPELEIVADDVRCTHGATISRPREEQLFYLRSRGIATAQASRLLLRGFCEEVRSELPDAAEVWTPLSFLHPEVRRP